MGSGLPPANGDGRVAVRVWDLPTRLFHWALALLATGSVVTAEFDAVFGAATLEWHRRFGLAILGLLLFRLLWGFVGGTHARFASFVRGPARVLAYARSLLPGRPSEESAGHNPLGGWSVVAMLSSLAVQAATGLFLVQEDYAFEAPLARHVSRAVSDRLGAIHEANAWILFALVALHVAAIAYYTVAKRQDLIGAMLGGDKRLPQARIGEASRGGGFAAAAVAAAIAAAAVWSIVTLA